MAWTDVKQVGQMVACRTHATSRRGKHPLYRPGGSEGQFFGQV